MWMTIKISSIQQHVVLNVTKMCLGFILYTQQLLSSCLHVLVLQGLELKTWGTVTTSEIFFRLLSMSYMCDMYVLLCEDNSVS